MTFTADKSPVILAGMPVSSHMDVKLQSDGNAKSSAYALSKLPSMALDFGIPAKMTAHTAIMRIAAQKQGSFLADTQKERTGLKLASLGLPAKLPQRDRTQSQQQINYSWLIFL